MRIPASKIKTGLYTSGKEYVYPQTTNFYKGYYYKINGKFYIGKTYDPTVTQEEIVEARKVSAINNPNSLLYNVLAGVKQGAALAKQSSLPVRNKPSVLASISAANQQGFINVIGINPDGDINSLNQASDAQVASSTPTTRTRYFYRQMISVAKLATYKFGETDEAGYNKLKDNFYYKFALIDETVIPGQTPVLNTDQLDAADAKIPGIKDFANNNVNNAPPTSTEAPPSTSVTTNPAPAATTPSPTPTASTSSGGGGGAPSKPSSGNK
jgi:hypothetical protein